MAEYKEYREIKLSNFNYDLPKELIALHPTKYRDESRLMVLHKDSVGRLSIGSLRISWIILARTTSLGLTTLGYSCKTGGQ